ncbi:hypothetical protein VM1G_02633 [Cytospora mali]|uniref:C2 domain-containing protein n=1 Tax=Cytospora mali TaxID=578113 RepID=A0A194VTY8_CYTMA|nr:hypothetical protein VM1G_02633 [Valsa mali]
MSTSSNRSYKHNSRSLNRSINRLQREDGSSVRRSRAGSRAFHTPVSYEDAYNYALSVAFLHYLLQPKKKRKEYVTVPKAPTRVHTYTQNIGDLMKEFIPTGGNVGKEVKLPHSFPGWLEKRMGYVVKGTERLPGFNDPNLKRTFAEAYTSFTESGFRKNLEKDRKLEPLILIFYSSATRAQGRGKAPDDHAWKVLVDRHLALFVRLIMSIFREHGTDKDKPELMSRLQTLEQKLLRNDENLSIDTGQSGEHKTIEVDIPHSYQVKDMHMVQIVGKIFGRTNSQLQSDVDVNRNIWTEESALKDLKAYQHRLDSNMDGALRRQDFDSPEAFDDWKAGERQHLTSMMLDILKVRPNLSKTATSFEKPLPVRPTSMSIYTEDQAFSDLAKMINSPDSPGPGGDPSFSFTSLNQDDTSSIRSVDEANYTFIPPEPRAFYKMILQHAMTFDQLNSESETFVPLSQQSQELLNELSVYWRIPQFTRLITFLEVAVRKFLDQELRGEELDECFDFVKNPQPDHHKKPPFIQLSSATLPEIEPSRWTLQDLTIYQQILNALHDALLRELYDTLMHCYEPKAPSIGVVMSLLLNHVYGDPVYTENPEDMEQFTKTLTDGLTQQAGNVYHGFLEKEVPQAKEDWNFTHVVNLGRAVTKLCTRIKKKYAKNPEILGVSPFAVLVKTIFPSFEEDAKALVETIVIAAKERGEEVNVVDGFDLYKELVEIRKIHVQFLPGVPFAFHIESVMEEFVWRWISEAETRMTQFVEQAIKQDDFQVRTQHPDNVPTDAERHSVSIIDILQLFTQTVDQIFQLEWQDDVHHAKFMTALAKAFAAGIGRYCEIVEGKFVKEMDRQTAQELAAAQKTAQERFMQMAKDAWNTKDKIEPFQFYPESFVKLNNIEYAMQSLDKLERLMKVDQCAEVLRAKEGPKQYRKPDKYVFTIKVVEAEDIKACDPNGYSDPYVVLVDEYQKRLAKTRVVSRTLNPRWDESVDVTVTGPVNVIATLWDYDTFGDHDFVGRTSLKLDPVHFSDYLPREFWLDLDTQGRLLIRVSMEGEKDDIQFHFGKAFRHLKRTERDMVRKITDKLTTVINASLSHEALKNLLSRGIAASIGNMWKTRKTAAAPVTQADVENALQGLFGYFDENFAIMKQTLTEATMLAVMTRLWKEVLMAIESLLVPPLSDKPSTQKPLTQVELDIVYKWLELLFEFFNAKDEDGEVLGVPAEVLKSPKWHELASLNFWYFDSTETLIRTSERMVAATQQRAQQQVQQASRQSAPPTFGPTFNSGAGAFGSMGTIRRGKSIMMSRNLGTMKRAKEEKRKEAQADPSDDMILRILRMRPEAVGYLRERHRQKERMAASQAAAAIVRQSIHQGFSNGAYGNSTGGAYGRGSHGNLPRR